MALTDRKSLFAQAIVDSGGKISSKAAAIAAGYSAKSAHSTGSRLRKDPYVVEHIAYLQGKEKPDETQQNAVNTAATNGGIFSPANPPPAQNVVEKTPNTAAEEGAETEDLEDPKVFLRKVQTGEIKANKMQVEAAKALLPYEHAKIAQQGKKDAQQEAAYGAGSGFFSPLMPPRPVQADLWENTDSPAYVN